MKRKVCVWTFAAYCVLMAWLLFIRERHDMVGDFWKQLAMNVNAVPLRTITRYLRLLSGGYSDYLRHHAAVNLFGNVIMFLPLGFFSSVLWKRFRPLWRCLLRCGGIVVLVELVQLFTLVGSCDVDDLLLNLLGIGLGYGLYHIMVA